MIQTTSVKTKENFLMTTVAKLALSVGAIGFALSGATVSAQTNVISDPVGFYKVTINPGANFVSAPLQQIQAFRGVISSISGNSINFTGSPAFVGGSFAPTNGFNQYIAIVRSDSDQNAPGSTNTIVGDWWPITANSLTNITVNPGADVLASHIEAGDTIEIRKLNTLKDLFGSGSSYVLNKDNDFDVNPANDDIIRNVVGTGFSSEIIYHDGTFDVEGYYVNGGFAGNGSTVTIEPDEPFVVQRRLSSAATNIVVLGQVQTTRLTHYLNPGANTFASVFPAAAPILSSNLKESGFVLDNDFDVNPANDDIVRSVVGTGFVNELIYHDGTFDTAGWYVDGGLSTTFNLNPGAGYVYFVKPGTGGRVWRQNVPFTP